MASESFIDDSKILELIYDSGALAISRFEPVRDQSSEWKASMSWKHQVCCVAKSTIWQTLFVMEVRLGG